MSVLLEALLRNKVIFSIQSREALVAMNVWGELTYVQSCLFLLLKNKNKYLNLYHFDLITLFQKLKKHKKDDKDAETY